MRAMKKIILVGALVFSILSVSNASPPPQQNLFYYDTVLGQYKPVNVFPFNFDGGVQSLYFNTTHVAGQPTIWTFSDADGSNSLVVTLPSDLDLTANLYYYIYGNWIASDKWNYEPASDTTVKYKYRTSKEETIETALAYKQDAAAVAALYLAIFGIDNNTVTLRARQKPLASDLSNTISLAIDRFNKNASAALLITKFDEEWTDRETVMTLIS